MRPSRPHILAGIGIALGGWVLLAALQWFGVFGVPDLKLLDWHYRLRGERVASDRLALVAVDDATISEYGRWPLPRETYAVLLAALRAGGARTVGFDLLFLGEDEDDPQGDRLLAALSGLGPDVVHGMAFVSDDPALGGGAATAPYQDALLMRHGLPVSGRWPISAVRVSLPYDALLAATPALGHVSVAVDQDGVVRRVPQFVRYGDRVYPSLAFRVAMSARDDSMPPRLEAEPGRVLVRWQDGRSLEVPVDAHGATAISFAGDRGSFRNLHSMIDALRWYRDGDSTRLRQAFEDRLVLVGTTAIGEVATDIGPTPFVEATPLVFIHANALDAVLEGRFLREPSPGSWLAGTAVLAALLGVVFMLLPLQHGIGLMVAATIGIAAVGFGAFLGGWQLPGTILLVLAPLTYAGTQTYRRVLTDRATQAREREMQVARAIQRKLLPTDPPQVPDLELWGLNIPAQEVGGDYYDWTFIGPERLAACVGDVSGKGVAAALLMSHLHASFRAEARGPRSPRAIVQAMNESLYPATEPARFATFFLALFERDARLLRFCNAGHNPALLIPRGGELQLLGATGLPLAVIEGAPYEDGEREFRSGDVLVLYSDGITEAQLRSDLYGDERLRALAHALVGQGLPARAIAEAILEDVRAFTRGNLDADDVTLLVVRAR